MLRTARYTLLTVILFIAVAAAVELLAMIVFKAGFATHARRSVVEHPYQPYLGWENAPSITIIHDCCGGRHRSVIEIDNQGHSVTPYLTDEHPDVDIVVLGGSTMFGVGSSNNAATVPSLIERELYERTGVRAEVHNLGVEGYTSFQEMLSLERYMATDRVDVAMSISGYNDAYDAAFQKGPMSELLPATVNPKAELVRSIERGELKLLQVGMNLLVSRLRERSYAIDLFAKVLDRIAMKRDPGTERNTVAPGTEEIERRARQSMTNYAMMGAMAKQNGAIYFMFLQPIAVTKKNLTAEERECLDSVNKRDIEISAPIERIFYDAIRRCEKSFVFYDISRCLDGAREPVLLDDAHYTDAGAQAIANAVCDVIAPVVVDRARKH